MDANGKSEEMITVWVVWNDGRKGEILKDKPLIYLGADPKDSKSSYHWYEVTRDMPNGKEVLAIGDLLGEDQRSEPYAPPSWSVDFEIPREWLDGFRRTKL